MIFSIAVGLFILIIVVFLLLYFLGANASFFITPIKGIMMGALYDNMDYPDEQVTEHTIQVLIIFVSFMFIWETNLNTDNE